MPTRNQRYTKMEDLVPAPFGGAHSTVGRATNRGMDKMREVAIELEVAHRKATEARKEAAERIAAERKNGSTSGVKLPAKAAAPGSPTGAGSPQASQDDSAPSPKRKAMPAKATGLPVPDPRSTPMGRAVRERLNLNPGCPAAVAGQGADSQSPIGHQLSLLEIEPHEPSSPTAKREQKCSPAFTNQGPQDQVFNEAARINLGRSFIVGKSWEPNPEGGKYKVKETHIMNRIPQTDLGGGSGHGTLKRCTRDKSNEFGPEDLTSLDFMFNKSGSMFINPNTFSTSPQASPNTSTSSWKGGSLMQTSIARPALNNIKGSRMGLAGGWRSTDISMPGNPEEQDKNLTSSIRPPNWDLTKQLGRKGDSRTESALCQFFEAGKYKVNHDAALPTAKKAMGWNKQLGRSSTEATKLKPPAMFDPSPHGTQNIADRSAYRHQPTARGRITHIMEMAKDTDRPPMIKHAKPSHDADDPEMCRLVHERAMSFDADIVDRSVQRRRDYCLNMGQSLPRDRAGIGARNAHLGQAGVETSGELSASVENLKDSTRIYRGDIGVTFEQCKSRYPTRLKGKYSSLHRPRDHAAPEFSRTVPFSGFATRTPVKVLPRSRSHDAMPGWSAEAVDGLETM